jgi:hypothetical protein
MKTTVITLAATAIFAVLPLNNASSKGYNGLYKNTIVNEETRVKTIEVYKGNGATLVPLQKYEVKLGADNNPAEKVVYEWSDSAWKIVCKYAYTVGVSGQVERLAYARWSEGKSDWIDIQYAIYNDNSKLLAGR